ncbi:hypothetical protein ACOSP7_001702 [Xanthoceras sorbifolium]|uniref:Late embryogenesis abundant protein LEA-2 subgroup domain-containing protein n=1 Tax=Xanthoceras sorbifolium TaxID=99658 RepID=A0ABQ8ILN3_9ROSI|nr:hypothetical protein JRO89_XS01G0246400 [Xanthoceras sorbifolium]
MPPRKLIHHSRPRTNPLVWCAAILCTIISIAVIITGIVVFIGYLIIHPRVPVISVINANLDRMLYDPAGLLETQITIVVRMKNDNQKAHASFSETKLSLLFDGLTIAILRADPFDVRKNSSVDFNYVVQSNPIPLDPEQQELVDMSLKEDRITFVLKGSARARWRIGPLGSVKFWSHLNCQLRFHPLNGTWIPSRCSSKAK